jgi:hypothetical protein
VVREEVAIEVGQSTATLRAQVDPNGLLTTYHFEWGTDTSYGNRLPADHERSAGSGSGPVTVSASLSGLLEGTVYHVRVVATNSAGSAAPDHEFSTLNSSGLPDNRRFELVSPADKRPQGAVTAQFGGNVIDQVAEDGHSLLFPLLGGLADTDSGGDNSYLATRSPSGWQSAKISPPSLVPAPRNGLQGTASSGHVVYNSPDLSCGVINTFNPLTADTPVADVELGIYNLYRRNPDGSHTLITSTVPANPDVLLGTDFQPGIVAGASSDCGRTYFQSPYQYLPNPTGLYEWDEGALRDAGRLPDGTAPVGHLEGNIGPPVVLGGEYGPPHANGTRVNSVSRDGSRFFFSAVSNEPGTSGKAAVFVRKGGVTTVEASRKQGGANDSLGARYETASPDGSHVLFIATYGLTPSSSNSSVEENCSNTAFGSLKACDLYDYNVTTGQLKDLSADSNSADSKGAVVQGAVAVSDDGSSIYFAARGQLVLGAGKTYLENTSGAGFANVYLARNGQLSYVATIAASDLSANGGALMRAPGWSAETTPDGDHLLFASRAKVTGYDSGGAVEAYLYSADSGTVQCVSCRPDDEPSVGGVVPPLIDSFSNSPSAQVQPRKMSDDGSRVVFHAPDVLAPGAVSGNVNLYEWERGQVYLLATGIGSQARDSMERATVGTMSSSAPLSSSTPTTPTSSRTHMTPVSAAASRRPRRRLCPARSTSRSHSFPVRPTARARRPKRRGLRQMPTSPAPATRRPRGRSAARARPSSTASA